MQYFACAILFLLIGHIFRMLRTFSVLNLYVDKPIKPFWLSLGIGYFADFFSPIRISDLIRTYTFSRMAEISWALPIALAIFERLLDILFLVFIILFFHGKLLMFNLVLLSISLFIIAMDTIWIKKIYLFFASLFNNSIKKFLLNIYWSIYCLRQQFLNNPRLIVLFFVITFLIMIFNILSVYFLSLYIGEASFYALFKHQFTDLRSSGIWNIFSFLTGSNVILYSIYILTPSVLALFIAFIPMRLSFVKNIKPLPFLQDSAALDFLEKFMTIGLGKADEAYYKLTHSVNIIKDLSAASDAKTFLIEKDGAITIRKIALNEAVPKLEQQYQWLTNNSHLRIPKIYSHYKQDHIFMFDMEYFANGESFFTMIHSLPVDLSYNIIKSILIDISQSYQEINNPKTTEEYFQQKVIANRKSIIASLSSLSNYQTIFVNGEELPNILHESTINYMHEYNNTLNYPIYEIHGDLTVDNILINSNQDYIIIDPSSTQMNIFAEYAKIFQSLHAKYEHVKRLDTIIQENNRIEYAQYATTQYEELFIKVKALITDTYGLQGLKATYFYESICHIRTASYMVKLGKEQKAILMIALAGNALKKWKEVGL